MINEVCERFKFFCHTRTPYQPKANGVVEETHKNIKKILKRKVKGTRHRQEKLPFALLVYRTKVHTLIGSTPYLLGYGTETLVLAEVKNPSLQIIVDTEIEDAEWVNTPQ
ncbi:uncharacterized protein [Solanum lycopersicum]|uniref:uncharacterized protein n=1 Tax=Solanum lycopersicum TaxID=4081 RepID=UPI000532CE9F